MKTAALSESVTLRKGGPAAGAALTPTVAILQESAHDLLTRMIAVK